MNWKEFLLIILTLLVAVILVVYLFVPYNVTELNFSQKPQNPNFNLDGSYASMQFYDNMRFPTTDISYRIDNDCTLSKKASMRQAFKLLENVTVLHFREVVYGEQITIQCDSQTQIEGGMFIAGEGGPTNITVAGEFNVITSGKILLLREPDCDKPNVPLHELLHVLGFDHSQNEDNIMYEVTKCRQTLGSDIPTYIDQLYSVPSYPDLTFEDVEGYMQGKYLNANLSVRNEGLTYSPQTIILIYADDKLVKEVNLDRLDIGYGTKITLYNIWVNKLSINEIKFVINSSYDELSKSNNEITLSLKK